MSKLSAFLLGAREYRLAITAHTDEPDAYDLGREWAHRVTLRKHEESE
jgi:hypothetical protein